MVLFWKRNDKIQHVMQKMILVITPSVITITQWSWNSAWGGRRGCWGLGVWCNVLITIRSVWGVTYVKLILFVNVYFVIWIRIGCYCFTTLVTANPATSMISLTNLRAFIFGRRFSRAQSGHCRENQLVWWDGVSGALNMLEQNALIASTRKLSNFKS